MQSANLHLSDIENYIHPYTNLSSHRTLGPMVIERGEGIYVFDDMGHRYLEALSGLWCAALGFSEARLANAADRQMRKLPFYHSFGHKSTEPSIKLAEKLISMAPVPMSKVFFANSGSEANDTAIKLVWYYNNALGRPKKKKIIARSRSYHGVTVATGSLTGSPANHQDFDLPIDRVLHTDCPDFYRYGLPGETEEDFATRCVESLEQLILTESPDTIAAFFAEPIMASAGMILPPATYIEKLQAVLKKYDILLIADEVICAFGRTGMMFGTESFGMTPDVITLAKQLSAGYAPISAVMVSDRIHRAMISESEKIGIFAHGFTCSGHPVCAAVALEALRIYEEDDMVGRVQKIAPHFQERVAALGEHPLVGTTRGHGLIAALELVADKDMRESFPQSAGVASYVGDRARVHGMITRASGDVVNFCPPLIITHDQIDKMFDAATKALDDAAQWLATTRSNPV
ncbi:Adenosylmethionine-8-amino-7-oxononanoate aminotransferase [Paraburkholderia ribeironis]|uniref:Adenosylmethionine-8-amino-7-oxononanoate aminotransferase n=1 Tax=Paraburkholderia ribeironis TaxID=1247936 RepID=A0A1N7RXG2_9BURK|nr:aspartate aminotransferase family protein [Paraburkholderia ribeironis]SIT39816.1 Adenosylmethionine-8-amino-7-oxononanoate aminotransferase [Paraburkholderia ribeironis]